MYFQRGKIMIKIIEEIKKETEYHTDTYEKNYGDDNFTMQIRK